jgi:cyclin-dependent kinase-like
VFEFLETTILGKIEKHPYGVPEEEVKRYMYQLLQGIRYCHSHNVITVNVVIVFN